MTDSQPPEVPKQELERRGDSGFYQPYAEFAKNLRVWLIAYGIGAPALILANTPAWDAVRSSGYLACIGALFLSGVALQIIQSLLYKHAMWHLYCGELDEGHKQSCWHKAAEWLSGAYVLELAFDIGTIILFAVATWILFLSLL